MPADRPKRSPTGRADRAGQPVGDLVRALPQGDARARRASGEARLADFEVVAVNIDTRDLDKPKAWLARHRRRAPRLLRRPDAKVFQDLKTVGKAIGMPTTLMVDPTAARSPHLAGPAEWASPDGVKLITAAMGK